VGIYEDLGVRRVINASATFTRLGGSLMPPEVMDAMAEASRAFVDLFELERAVSREIAALVDVPAAYVTSGASAGLLLSSLACMTGPDLVDIARFAARPDAWPRREIVVQAAQRNPYDRVLTLAHARMVEVGDTWQTFDWELEGAIGPETAAVFHFAGLRMAGGALPLADVIRIAHRRNVPVVVDAAAQVLPASNLHDLVAAGADLVLFSGGKAIRGPQASGLVLGDERLVRACREHGAPNQRLGRPLKVGKEELVGLLVAVRRFLALDADAVRERWEAQVAAWVTALGAVPGIRVERDFPGEAGLPVPRARITLDPAVHGPADDIAARLLDGEPAVSIMVDGPTGLLVAPDCLEQGEGEIVARRLLEVLG
jgi:L-seryl-tRNA(Ser) seleniumtransferase